jgi:hypothetical protein
VTGLTDGNPSSRSWASGDVKASGDGRRGDEAAQEAARTRVARPTLPDSNPSYRRTACERCGAPYQPRFRKRFCSRRCQMNTYFERRLTADPAFHQRALEYQRLWRVKERARRQTDRELA